MKEQSATVDAPPVTVVQGALSGGQEQVADMGQVRRKEGGFVARVRRLLQRIVAVFGIPVTESS